MLTLNEFCEKHEFCSIKTRKIIKRLFKSMERCPFFEKNHDSSTGRPLLVSDETKFNLFLEKQYSSSIILAEIELTEREQEILKLFASGVTKEEEMGEKLFISGKTVHTHFHNIMKKLKVNDKVQLLIKAIRLNLVSI